MGFYATTENPNVVMRENHNTQSCEYIILCQYGLYIVWDTPEEILLILKDKYKIIFTYRINIHMILVKRYLSLSNQGILGTVV